MHSLPIDTAEVYPPLRRFEQCAKQVLIPSSPQVPEVGFHLPVLQMKQWRLRMVAHDWFKVTQLYVTEPDLSLGLPEAKVHLFHPMVLIER